ncbi:MAG: carboxypeptidase regulatory-like domain-containing protein [Oscillospiraceae bacterium]|nr:carboxypeptidase regulatory-like domain-containing protein [Oscillospiraceae bacterium]
MILDGYIKDKYDQPVEQAVVELKNNSFETLFTACTDTEGYYRFDIPAGYYPFFFAVKGYKESGLEYWCQDIVLDADLQLDAKIDTLEVYGLHCFTVKGAANGLMVYFRPMALDKYLKGCQDIAPDDIHLQVTVDGNRCPVVNMNKVIEYAGAHPMTAWLIQVSTDKRENWHKVDVEIWDENGNYGAASVFNN